MLVCCRMKDDLWFELMKDAVEPHAVTYGTDHHRIPAGRVLLLQFFIQLKHAVLVDIKDYKRFTAHF
ncbi:hypothetical protein SDC9_177497 [bioreactor metagenome]|uniref:Uncharacterized protein n=1 Tax=bioreactor metagenome TaxID=1076179 RepID=A0A645GUM6_9ZZZZ